MKKAWMPLIVVTSCVWLVGGCNLDGWGMKLRGSEPGAKPLASTPIPADPAPPPAGSFSPTAQAGDPELKPLADRVQNFVGQFPPDDRDRQAVAGQLPGVSPVDHALSPGGTFALSQTVPPGQTVQARQTVPPGQMVVAVPTQGKLSTDHGPSPGDATAVSQTVPPGQAAQHGQAVPSGTTAVPVPTRTEVGMPPGQAASTGAGATPAATANRPSTVRDLAATYPHAAALPLPDAFGSTALPGAAADPGAAGEAVVGSPQAPSPLAPAVQTPHVELIEVRPVLQPAGASATQPSEGGANQPVRDGGRALIGDGIAELIASVEAVLAQNPNQLDSQFKLRLLYTAAGDEEKAVGPIKGADPVQADLVAAVFRAMKTARAAMRDPAAGSGPALAAVEELKRLIAQQSPVMMPKLALVTRVNSFGDYDAVNPPQFPAGKPVHVFLYTEVANFRTESTPDNHLRTVLAEKVEIFDADGKIIWQRSEPTIEDKTLTPRHDFFMTMEIELPADMPAGDYILKVTIEDKLAATADQQRMGFSIR